MNSRMRRSESLRTLTMSACRLIAPEEDAIVYAIFSRAARDIGAMRGAS